MDPPPGSALRSACGGGSSPERPPRSRRRHDGVIARAGSLVSPRFHARPVMGPHMPGRNRRPRDGSGGLAVVAKRLRHSALGVVAGGFRELRDRRRGHGTRVVALRARDAARLAGRGPPSPPVGSAPSSRQGGLGRRPALRRCLGWLRSVYWRHLLGRFASTEPGPSVETIPPRPSRTVRGRARARPPPARTERSHRAHPRPPRRSSCTKIR